MAKQSTTSKSDRSALAHARTEKRKARRKALDAGAQEANRILRSAGELTPWEEACAKRRARRSKMRAKAGGQS